jgi:uncharacterized protein
MADQGGQGSQESEKRREAGRKGGETTKEKYGEGFYSEIGREGGERSGESRQGQSGQEKGGSPGSKVDQGNQEDLGGM